MTVLTMARSVVALPYKALRYPSQLLETKVVAVRMPEDSGLRLAYERVLGALDSGAGSLLSDQDLTDRGRALTRRAAVIEKAVSLEAKAEQRKTEADDQLRVTAEKAKSQRAEARKSHQQDVTQSKEDRQKARAAADRKAEKHKQAERKAVADKTRSRLDAEKKQADDHVTRIAEETAARTAAPKAQLSGAVEDTKAAAERAADAEQLARLADQEKLSRQDSNTG